VIKLDYDEIRNKELEEHIKKDVEAGPMDYRSKSGERQEKRMKLEEVKEAYNSNGEIPEDVDF